MFAVSAAVHLLGANPLRAWLDALLTPDATAPAPAVRVVQVSDAAWQMNREVKDPPLRRSAPRADGAASAPKPSFMMRPSSGTSARSSLGSTSVGASPPCLSASTTSNKTASCTPA